jgi:hypothetical protein
MLRRKLLVIVAIIGLLTIFTPSPAHAGDAARYCKTYYHLNNKATGWGFTVCVKLQHDPTNHAWRATGSVSTTVSGMLVNLYALHYYSNGVLRERGQADQDISFATSTTDWWYCAGYHGYIGMYGVVGANAQWPNGTWSSNTNTYTLPGKDHPENYYGTC